VRSAISSCSNSAKAAKMPKTSLPAAVVVSMAAPCPLNTFRLQANTTRGKVVDGIDQMTQISSKPVQFPYQ